MEEFIAGENIRRFEAQLETCTDEGQKAAVERLLEAERSHLQEILQAQSADPLPRFN